jgi:hypothetical protein
MAGSVTAVANGIKNQLATVEGLRTFSYQPEQLNPPLAFPILNAVDYHRAFGGGDVVMDWSIMVIVGRYLDRVAHANLDAYLAFSGATSIREAIEADKSLGGACKTLVLESAANINSLTVAEADFLSIEFQLTVHA